MARSRPALRVRAALAFAALAACVLLSGCGGPPMLSKADLDSGKMPKKHPKLTPQQIQNGCRSCHRERPEAQPAK